MIIPWQDINADTLTNLLEEYASRDGTDYGVVETSLQRKVEQLRDQLVHKHIVIVYSELHESINILSADQFHAQGSES